MTGVHYICINMGKLYYSLLNEIGGNCREQRIPDRDIIWCTQIHLFCVLIMLYYLLRKLYLFCAHITYVLGTHTVIHVSGVHIALFCVKLCFIFPYWDSVDYWYYVLRRRHERHEHKTTDSDLICRMCYAN
jgi:hypothetical protein